MLLFQPMIAQRAAAAGATPYAYVACSIYVRDSASHATMSLRMTCVTSAPLMRAIESRAAAFASLPRRHAYAG